MVFWGSAIDASKAQKFEALVVEDLLPPPEETQNPVILPSTTTSMKQHPKPTANLPDDHGHAAGENTRPAFSAAKPTSTSTNSVADAGWLSESSLMRNQKWLFIALGVVLLFGIAVGIFFWRRHVAKKAARYTELNDEREMSINPTGSSAASGGLRTTRELYDPFGHVSDEEDDEDDDDDDETTALRSARGGFGFQADILKEDPSLDAPEPSPQYRDDPESEDEEREEPQENKQHLKVEVLSSAAGPPSPIGSGVAPSEHMPSHE